MRETARWRWKERVEWRRFHAHKVLDGKFAAQEEEREDGEQGIAPA